MRRSAHSNLAALGAALAAVGCLPLGHAQPVSRENGKWVRVMTGTAPAAQRLRILAHGPVTLEGGTSREFSYTVKVSVTARTAAEAEAILRQYAVRAESENGWMVLSAPGGAAMSNFTVRAPRLAAAAIVTSDGAVRATGVEGSLEATSRGGELVVDRIGGSCSLVTTTGDIEVGEVGGSLRCATQGGRLAVKSVRGEALLQTAGGDIRVGEAGGPVLAQTGGGELHVGTARSVVTAINGGGPIIVERSAGVQCQSAGGAVRVANINGAMNVSTSMGNIVANLLGSRLADSFLATGSGDITVLIPSNVGVTIQAQNNMADTLRRIVSEFPGVQPRRQGPRVLAEGAVNGGGPLLRISGMGGTIFIKRQ